jgi:negative regulator of sigma E activity
MDGELGEREAAETIAGLTNDAQACHAWRAYHLIGDAMSESRSAIAPRRPAANAPRWRVALPAMAIAAAIALVSWVAFAPVQQSQPPQSPQLAEAKPAAIVPPPRAANDYLLAHQGFSPRIALQGMAIYVRTVSDPAEEPRR